jgi:hypothetical protein
VIVSGALYLVVLSCEVVTFATNSYLFNVFLDMVSVSEVRFGPVQGIFLRTENRTFGPVLTFSRT